MPTKKRVALILAVILLLAVLLWLILRKPAPSGDAELPTQPQTGATEPTNNISAPTQSTTAPTEITAAPTQPTEQTQAAQGTTQAPTAPPSSPATQPTTAPASTQKPTQISTQKPTQAPTQKPTQTPTQKPTQAPIPPANLQLIVSPDYVEIDIGETYALTATYNGTGKLRWGSFHPDIATVDDKGTVTGKNYGLAQIYLTDGTKLVYTFIQVTPPRPTIDPNNATLALSQSALEMDIFYAPQYLDYYYDGIGTLTWTSSDTSVATVSQWGEVSPVGLGQAIITVTDGTLSARCTVTVRGIEFTTPDRTKIVIGETLQLQYKYSGSGTKMTWRSEDESILTVDSNGMVTGVSAGGCTVFLSDDTGISNNILVVVITEENKTVSLHESGHNGPLYDGVVKYAGDSMTLRVNTRPYGVNPKVTVKSSNPEVVSITNNYHSYYEENNITLQFKQAGTAKITITSADDCVSHSYTITVKPDYECNPGPGILTPEEFVHCYNQVLLANGMAIDYKPTGYLVLTLSPNELTWEQARREAEGLGHHWWSIGYRHMLLTFEGVNEDGNYVFYERGG